MKNRAMWGLVALAAVIAVWFAGASAMSVRELTREECRVLEQYLADRDVEVKVLSGALVTAHGEALAVLSVISPDGRSATLELNLGPLDHTRTLAGQGPDQEFYQQAPVGAGKGESR